MRGLRAKMKILEDSDFGIGNKKEIISMAETVKKNFKRTNKKRKNKDFGTKNPKARIEAPAFHNGLIEYKMPGAAAEDILNDKSFKGSAQEILCEYVNTQCGLLGYCVKVHVY